MTLGVLIGYYGYAFTHHAAHHWRHENAWLRRRKRWHALHTLEVFYRDGFNNQLNDRYQDKVDEYRDLARLARAHTLRFGIGLVSVPLPMAEPPKIDFVAGPLAQATYYIQVTWVSSSGQEGEPSKLTTADAVPGALPVITAVNPPSGAIGFRVYMGLTDSTVALQTATPVATGASFTLAGTGLIAGRAPGMGQAPDYYITGGAGLTRG